MKDRSGKSLKPKVPDVMFGFAELTSKLQAILLFGGVRPQNWQTFNKEVLEFFKSQLLGKEAAADGSLSGNSPEEMARLFAAAEMIAEQNRDRLIRLKQSFEHKPFDREATLRIAGELCGVEYGEEKSH